MNPLHCDCCEAHLDADAAIYCDHTGLLLCPGCDLSPLDDSYDMDMGPADALPELDIFGPWLETEGAHSLRWF